MDPKTQTKRRIKRTGDTRNDETVKINRAQKEKLKKYADQAGVSFTSLLYVALDDMVNKIETTEKVEIPAYSVKIKVLPRE